MSTERNPQRRRFLKTLGLGTVAAGATAGLGQVPLVRAEATPQDAARRETPRGYRETAHIRAYYATLRD
ncbi:twin-arginine translocation signal domain-containing protein [Halomonas nitroreducens]|uniref:Twin-arginine translocation signal domain-containing protein n=1 Tax=Halomonas nitroreducens TaxID=447425 RepID=A0A3S0KRM9_9GAMM|nr:twin-arginine translocation signal domain-containing protein [Halomonas nitroreducens]RTR05010.1 twin-arginine translocation signal domain-containing protein [Halomonas nitroreducens]